jgi:hypothetical protein
MGSKYYTHFIAAPAGLRACGEWSGVVELTRPLRQKAETRELSLVLAHDLDLELDDIRILDWSPLH